MAHHKLPRKFNPEDYIVRETWDLIPHEEIDLPEVPKTIYTAHHATITYAGRIIGLSKEDPVDG